MNLQEKTLHLQEAAMTEARLEADAIVTQHKNALQNVLEQHKKEALIQSETRIKAEMVTARQQLNMATSKAHVELKRELGKVQNDLKSELFCEVEQLLQEYMKKPEYTDLLISYIQKAAAYADGAAMTIYINETDADKKKYLEEYTGMALTSSKEDFIGGVRSVSRDKNILIDQAFKGALEREKQKFLFKGGTVNG